MTKQEASKEAFVAAFVKCTNEAPNRNAWHKETAEKYHLVHLYMEAIENENAPHALLEEAYRVTNRL